MWGKAAYNSVNKILFLLVTMLVFGCTEEPKKEFTSLSEISVDIISLFNNKPFVPGELIDFQGIVNTGVPNDLTKLKSRWISDKDGVLIEQNVKENGTSFFSTNSLSKNVHEITFEVRNEIGSILIKKIVIFNAIKLTISKENNYSVTVRWSSMPVSDFHSYKLYRSSPFNGMPDPPLIAEITDFADSIFVDTTAILGQPNYYQVYVDRTSNIDFCSRAVSTVPGEFVTVDYPLLKIVADNKRNYFYGIVAPPTMYYQNKTGYGVVFVNTETLSVEKRILDTVRFTDFDIDPSGDYLYLCANDKIYKVSLATQELIEIIPLLNAVRLLEIGSNSRLYYHVAPAGKNIYQFRIVDLSTGTELSYKYVGDPAYWSFEGGDFEVDDSDNTIFHGGQFLTRFSAADDEFSSPKQVQAGDGYYDNMIYRNGFIFWNYGLYDKELNFLGYFANAHGKENIYDASPNGTLAIGSNNLYSASTRTILKEIPMSFYQRAVFLNSKRLALVSTEMNSIDETVYHSTIYVYTFSHQ
ncbi:MAG: hypothetical protein ABI663_14905 [Chryseolinea sp.]